MLEVNGNYASDLTVSEIRRQSSWNQLQLGDPLVAIVIPAFKQPGFLLDAVHTALRQSMRTNIRVVIVNDGCPYQSTDELGQLFQTAHPGRVIYLRKPNGGLSSARNYGIRFSLDAWPSTQAIFPLDADNVLSAHTIEKLWQSLNQAPDDIGWAYHDLNIIGNFDAVWRTTPSFSVYRLAFENISDAGALIHRRVFETGIWYDENMKRGYEDWEFFLHTALEGFRAVHVPDTGFYYRRHGHSMLADARQGHSEIYESMQRKHADRLGPQQLTKLEHQEMPRYALIELDRDRVRWSTNLCGDDHSVMTISAYIDALTEWHIQPRPKAAYIPPIVLISHGAVIEFLQRLRILPGLQFGLQALLARNDCAFLNLERAEHPYLLRLNEADEATQPVVLAISTRRLVEEAKHGRARMRRLVQGGAKFTRAGLTLSVGMSHAIHAGRPLEYHRSGMGPAGPFADVIPPATELLDDLAKQLHGTHFTAMRQQVYEEGHRYAAANATFAAQQQLDRGLGTYPYFTSARARRSPGTGIWFITSRHDGDPANQAVMNLAQHLSGVIPEYPLHLVASSGDEIEVTPQALDPFENITFLTASETFDEDEVNREEELLKVLAGSDAVIIDRSQTALKALPQLRAKPNAPVVIGLLQSSEQNQFAAPDSFAVLASRHYAQLIDHLVVPTLRLRRTCVNLGAPEDKVIVIPVAPAVHPQSLEAGLQLAQAKARRSASPDHPLRILIAGGFDEQGRLDRLSSVRVRLSQLGAPFELQAIGKAVAPGRDSGDSHPGVTFLPAAQELVNLAQHLTDADVLVLLSRSGETPWIALEAMSFGNVVIATNTGGIDEVVKHGRNGYLVSPDLGERDIPTEIGQLIAGIATGSLASADLRTEAVRTAMSFTWCDAAERVAALVEPDRGGRDA